MLCGGSVLAQPLTQEEVYRYFTVTLNQDNTITLTRSQWNDLTLENLEIPETVIYADDGEAHTITTLGDYAIQSAKNLKSVKLPASITTIGEWAITNNELLESIIIDGEALTIERGAFAGNGKLEKIEFNGYIKSIRYNAFSGTPFVDFVFKDGLETMELPLQDGTYSLTLPQSLREIRYPSRPDVQDQHKYMWFEWFDAYGYPPSGVTGITFNVTDLEAWCTTPITGYNPKKYKYSDKRDPITGNLYGDIAFTGEFIPVTINYRGKEITSLSVPMGVETLKPYAFAGMEALTDVSLPDGLKEIGEGVFGGTSISDIELPESVETIGDYAFASDAELQEILFPAGLSTIGDYAFYGNKALYEVEIPGGVKRIGGHAFDRCLDMESITFNEGLEEIGDYAFMYNNRVTEVKFPESLQKIGNHAFAVCSMREVEFGDNLKSIGNWAFARYDTWLEGEYPEVPKWWDDSEHEGDPTSVIKFGKSLESLGDYSFAAWNVRNLELPETLGTIGSFAFQYAKISSVTLPSAITSLSASAFEQCPKLAVVNFSEGLRTIGPRAFANTAIRNITFPSTLTEIGERVFESTPIVNAVIPDGVTKIGENAFQSVNYLTIGKGVSSISKPIAESCDLLKMVRPTPPTLGTDRLGFTPKVVIVPAEAGDTYRKNNRWKDFNIFGEGENRAVVNVNKEANEQLADQLILQSRMMPAQVASLVVYGSLDADDWAVIRSNMTSLYDLDLSNISNTEIPADALKGKGTLLNVALPDGTLKIGDNAFYDCTLMHMESVPASLVEIGASAFEKCKSLDSDWTMPASLTTVGENAFFACESLRGIDFSATAVTSLGEGSEYDGYYIDEYNGMFARTFSLASLQLPSALEVIPAWAFSNSGITTLEIPESVKEIAAGAFYNASVKSLAIPQSVEKIGGVAFKSSSIETISIPASVKSLGDGAFANTPLVYADFSNGLEALPENVFADCQDLMVVNLPATLKSIGADALAAPSLAAINAPVTDPAATVTNPYTGAGNPFTGVNNLTCALSIPRESFTKYVRAEYWGSFVGTRNNIDVTIPDPLDVTYIDEDDYQEMVEDMEEETPEEPVSARRRALRVLRANSVISSFKGYGKLFNGASLYRDSKGKTRFFVNVSSSDLKNVRVEYNNRDITSQIDPETCSFVTDALNVNATLKITYKDVTGIEEMPDSVSIAGPVDVYDMTGRMVLMQTTDFSSLPAGIYVAGGKKIVVR